eukprot:6227894-Prorocentrum_lima.AAC.1
MLGEERLRTEDEKSARASREVSARLQHVSTASALTAAPATKGKGTCNKFFTDDGCPMERACPYERPRDSPNI